MCAYYLFNPDFCNIASAWEKGIVEIKVQDIRRRIWLDAQDNSCLYLQGVRLCTKSAETHLNPAIVGTQ
jgi:hypothetical protein